MCALILSLFMPRVVHRVLSQNRGGCQCEAILCAVIYLTTTTVLYAMCCAVPAAPAPGHPGGRGGRVRHHCAVPCAVLSAAPAAATCVCRTQLCTVMYNVLNYSPCLALIEFGCVCYAVCLVDVTWCPAVFD